MSHESSDKTQEWHIPKERGLPGAEGKFCHSAINPALKRTFVSRLLAVTTHAEWVPELWLLLASQTYLTENTHWTNQLSNSPKNDNNIFQHVVREMRLFLLVQKSLPYHRIVVDLKINF